PPRTNGPAGVTATPGGGLMLNFNDVSIDVVLSELSAVAGFKVLKIVRPEGKINLVSKQPVKPSEAISLLNSVLRSHGYVAIQQEDTLKIISVAAAKKAN